MTHHILVTILWLTGALWASAPIEKITAPASCAPANAYPTAATVTSPFVTLNPNADAPQLYAQFSLLTKSERTKFFNVISGRNKARVWAIHLQTFALSHDLNLAQQAFIDKYTALFRSSDFDTDRQRLTSATAGAKAEALNLFTPLESFELIAHLGGSSPLSDNRQLAHYFLPVPNWNKPDCECNDNADNCEWQKGIIGAHCTSPTSVCNYESWGCGPFWVLNCWALCVPG